MANKEVQDTSSRGSLENPNGSLGGRMGWKHLWNLNVKQKIKVFIWKCMNNALPVRELIYDRTKLGEPICTGCGEGEETVEHLLFHCKNAEQVWNISPVQWEGVADQRGCFRRWWSALLGARARQGGLEHICLTANILWQLWKARNERVFKEKNKLPLQVIQKAMQEWMEHREAMEGIRKESITETFDAVDESEHNTVEGEGIDVQVAITVKKERQVVGIGVMANDSNGQEKAIWAMRERSAGQWLLDYAEALKLAMAKARAKQWSHIRVGITDQQLLRQLRSGKAKDIRLFAQVEEIDRLSSMFVQCSFYLVPDEQHDRLRQISSYATSIPLDEER
ncbi:uncharacterized protein LOC113777281 [Coffea eugenioides]|uniref:uncharacterized protein LOC113777281 n=1 Tax=Coffea eugenioides TaxID=49369 RepID=UPI000F5C3FAE|nr:uncharacterized protein LOC113700861 [Coffea arabica]XP_027178118.1 uncharacterized protein LOC113777281 [Coffea eugenioides]